MPPDGKPLVFVYGTLKRSFGNHRVMMEAGGAFVTEGETVTPFPLVQSGLPFLIFKPGHGQRVEGEIFRVGTRRGWDRLDRLEGHPDFYRRRLIDVAGADGETYEAWAYFLARHDEVLAGLPHLCAYGRDSGVRIPVGNPRRPVRHLASSALPRAR